MCLKILLYFMYNFFFFNDTATTEIYTLSLHDALPISHCKRRRCNKRCRWCIPATYNSSSCRNYTLQEYTDRKSTRLNSSHLVISYAVFCLKKKNSVKKLSPPKLYDEDFKKLQCYILRI